MHPDRGSDVPLAFTARHPTQHRHGPWITARDRVDKRSELDAVTVRARTVPVLDGDTIDVPGACLAELGAHLIDDPAACDADDEAGSSTSLERFPRRDMSNR